METIREFGIQPILLVAQGINFLILVFLLRRFLYKPMLNMLEERKERIAKGMREAQEIEERLKEVKKEQEALLHEARKEAAHIIAQAKEVRDMLLRNASEEAKRMANKLISQAKQGIATDKEAMRRGLRQELSGLVALVSEKLLMRSLSPTDRERLLKESISEVAKG